MKKLIITLSLGLFIQIASTQTVAVNNDHTLDKVASTEKYPANSKREVVKYTLSQLTDSITIKLKNNELLRQNYSKASAILELIVDEQGIIYSYEVSDDTSLLMTKIMKEIVGQVNEIDLKDLKIDGTTKLKIPFHYSL